MARITVEDCMRKLDNRFELVAIAGYRAKEINKGSKILVEKDNDKDAVIALREIAADKTDPKKLEEKYIQTLRKNYNPDIAEEENKDQLLKEATEEISEFEVPDDSITVENYMFDDEENADD